MDHKGVRSTIMRYRVHLCVFLCLVTCILLIVTSSSHCVTQIGTLQTDRQRTNISNGSIIYPRVILFGDSITQRSFSHDGQWGSLLADRLQRVCDVVNRGFSGYTSRQSLQILDEVFSSENVDHIAAVTVLLGTNDIAQIHNEQRVTLREYKDNMLKILTSLKDIGINKNRIILIGIPPVAEDKFGRHNKRRGVLRNNTLAKVYAGAGQDVAKQNGFKVVELYKSMMKETDWQNYLTDGVHLSASGSQFLFDRLWKVISTLTTTTPISG